MEEILEKVCATLAADNNAPPRLYVQATEAAVARREPSQVAEISRWLSALTEAQLMTVLTGELTGVTADRGATYCDEVGDLTVTVPGTVQTFLTEVFTET